MSAELAWEQVDSSNVKRVAYDDDSTTLAVEFNNGYLYTYPGVSNDEYHNMMGSASVGHYLANVIKATYPYVRHYSEEDLIASLY